VAGPPTRGLTSAAGPDGHPRPYTPGEPQPHAVSEPHPRTLSEPEPRTLSELPLGDDPPAMAEPVPPLPGDHVPGSAAGGTASRRPAGSGYPSGGSATYRPGRP
jgi:hypothetical protein